MNYDLNRMRLGRCMNCRMRGTLVSKPMVRPADVSSLDPANCSEDPKAIATILVCVTCFETPAGIRSENLEHQRLPKEEYEKK